MVRGFCMGHSPPGSPLSFSSLWEAISTRLLPSGSPFVFAHSHSCLMAGHHMPLLKLILLTGIVSSTYQPFMSYPPQVQTDTPLCLPIPHPTLDITRKIYSKAISKSYCWKYRIALDSGPSLGGFPQKALWLWHWTQRIVHLNRLRFLGSLRRMSSGTVPEASPKSRHITSSAVPP